MVKLKILTAGIAQTRRRVLQAILGGLVSIPLAWAERAFGPRPAAAFRAETLEQTLIELYGDRVIPRSDKIRIAAADLAENGAVVPINNEADFSQITTISIIATKNPVPLVAKFVPGKTTTGFIATRIKLAESCDVIAVVETADGIYQARKAIEVTIGGCGT